MKKIKITEQQFENVLMELDVAAITKAATEYGKSEEDSQEKFKTAISQALGMGDGEISEGLLDESLIDYSLIFKALQHILSPEQMQFMRDSYEAMNYTSIDHIPTLRTGEILLFVEYLIYIGTGTIISPKIKDLLSLVKQMAQIGVNIAKGMAKRIKGGMSAKDTVAEFLDAVREYSKNDDEILQENLVVSEKSNIFAERKFSKRQIYETISRRFLHFFQ